MQLNFQKLPKTEEGFPYAVFYERPTHVEYSTTMEPAEVFAPKGGKTTVVIYTPDGEEIAKGEAFCHPVKDGFNKRLGRQIALGRALKNLRENTDG